MSGDRATAHFEMVASTRRQFSREQKLAIVAEVERGATVSEVARRHNVHTSLLFRWRREFGRASSRTNVTSREPEPKPASFLPMRVVAPTPSIAKAPHGRSWPKERASSRPQS